MPKTEVFNREDVLKQATEVFHTKGYNATSMQDLVDATGLNRSSIYNSFKSKQNLYVTCLKVYENKYQRIISKLLLESNSPINAIKSLFNIYLKESLSDNTNKGCLIINCKSEMANQDIAIHKFLLNNQKGTLQLLEDLIEKGQKDKSINKNKSKEAYALYLFSSMQGFRMTSILVNDKNQLQGLIQTTLQNLK
ncbi:TetR/AcrR family transcriptional regulator [Winogradskyella luteola]|uniref:TetR/AcrR family transcriptional regulator n=1 Tax=Winogradskyella luteola TaxID=2828330 RepID=A0A9X1F6X5_9FLAO|nr:TetR/AcrR family transcriptional regulator [Winogradskyella luteola]MBV7268251.1 TetR/AcrR family transcriptional regulator [Winogradskyella luteola]